MHAELLPFIECQHGADHQDTARALVIMWACPYLAPCNACDEVLKLLVERCLLGVCTIDPVIAKDLTALGHTAFVAFLVVHGPSPSAAEEVEYGLGVLLRHLDIRDVCCVEARELGALDLFLDSFAGGRRCCRILFADDDQSWRCHAR